MNIQSLLAFAGIPVVSVLVGVTLISLAALLPAAALRRRSALRHTVLLSGLAGCLSVPGIVLLLQNSGPVLELPWLPRDGSLTIGSNAPETVSIADTGQTDDSLRFAGDEVPASAEVVTATVVPAEYSGAIRRAEIAPVVRNSPLSDVPGDVQVSVWLMGGWLSVSVGLLGFVLRSLLKIRQIALHAETAVSDRVTRAANIAAKHLGINGPPPVMTYPCIKTPAVVGLVSPVVLLPADLVSEVNDDELADILIHEFAHVMRYDTVMVLLQSFTRCLLWPVPTIHLLNRALSRAREEICDNFVLQQRDGLHYGQILLRLAERSMAVQPITGSLGMLDWHGRLETRIRQLLDEKRSAAVRTSRGIAAMCVCLFFLLAVVICGTRLVAEQTSEDPQRTAAVISEREAASKKAGETTNEPSEELPPIDLQKSAKYVTRIVDEANQPVVGARVKLWQLAFASGSTFPPKEYVREITSGADGTIEIDYPKLATTADLLVTRVAFQILHPDFAVWSDYRHVMEPAPIQLPTPVRVAAAIVDPDGNSVTSDLYGVYDGSAKWSIQNGQLTSGPIDLKNGSQLLRIARAGANETVEFTPLINLSEFKVVDGRIELNAQMQPAVLVAGRLSENVSRPVRNGYVSVRFVRGDYRDEKGQWSWISSAPVRPDGTFELKDVPAGEHMQMIGWCDGWISTPPPLSAIAEYQKQHDGFPHEQHYHVTSGRVTPQLFPTSLGSNEVELQMHQTGNVKLKVVDWDNVPIANAEVSASPNVYWLQSGSTLIGSVERQIDHLKKDHGEKHLGTGWQSSDRALTFRGTTDSNGMATLNNLPAHGTMNQGDYGNSSNALCFTGIRVKHPNYRIVLKQPVRIHSASGGTETVDLRAGETTSATVRMERKQSPRSVVAVPSAASAPGAGPAAKPSSRDAGTKASPEPPADSKTAKGENKGDQLVNIEVTGVATDAEGKPVAGASIRLVAVNDAYKLLATATSDKDGRYRFEKISSPGRTLDVFGTKDGFGLAWHGMRSVIPDQERPATLERGSVDDHAFYSGEPVMLDLKFTRPQRLHGQILNETGSPVSGVELTIAGIDYLNTEGRVSHHNFREFWGLQFVPEELWKAKTDDEGRFEFTRLPEETSVWLQVVSEKYARQALFAAITNSGITTYRRAKNSIHSIQNGKQTSSPVYETNEFQISPLMISLVGTRQQPFRVVDSSGKPVAGLTVFASNGDRATGTSAFGKTNESGEIILDLPPGDFRTSVRAPKDTKFVSTTGTVTVPADQKPQIQTITMMDGCEVVLIAVDADSGAPIKGIGFWLGDGSRQYELQRHPSYIDHECRTDENGEARAILAPGVHEIGVGLTVLPKPYQGAGSIGSGSGREVKCEPGQIIRVTFELRKD